MSEHLDEELRVGWNIRAAATTRSREARTNPRELS
jgi:hypothetical protein